MPLSNAERQKLHRERQKAKLAGSAAGIKETIETAIARDNAMSLEDDPNDTELFTLEDYAAHLAGADLKDVNALDAARRVDEAVKVAVLEALALPDPWPGLTCEALRDMVGDDRMADAYRRGLFTEMAGRRDMKEGAPAPPLTLAEKIVAARNREWLDNETAKKNAEKARKRREANAAKGGNTPEARREKRERKEAERLAAEAEAERIERELFAAEAEAEWIERIERERRAAEEAKSREDPDFIEAELNRNPNFGMF